MYCTYKYILYCTYIYILYCTYKYILYCTYIHTCNGKKVQTRTLVYHYLDFTIPCSKYCSKIGQGLGCFKTNKPVKILQKNFLLTFSGSSLAFFFRKAGLCIFGNLMFSRASFTLVRVSLSLPSLASSPSVFSVLSSSVVFSSAFFSSPAVLSSFVSSSVSPSFFSSFSSSFFSSFSSSFASSLAVASFSLF